MPEPIEWKDEYECGLLEVDIQHKKLLRIAKKLYDIAQKPVAEYKRGISLVVKELGDYTKYHFETEETLMKQYFYPQFDDHSMSHSDFILETLSQLDNLSDANPCDGLQLYGYLCNWVVNHIAKEDKDFGHYVLYVQRKGMNKN